MARARRDARMEVRVRGPRAAAAAEALAAEAWEAGIVGLEEREEGEGRVTLILYLPEDRAPEVERALRASGLADAACEVGAAVPVEEVDWSEAWKRGLGPLEISPRLVVRPSFVAAGSTAGATVIEIDPGQAFGTGSHASTRLALECLDAERAALAGADRVLDVGTGSGILALAALALGARRAVGLDLDPLSPPEARRAARHNRLDDRLALLVGPIEAVAGARFDWVLANLLRREMEPIGDALADAVAPGGRLVLSGLLVDDAAPVVAALAARGLSCESQREARDDTGDHWVALVMRRSGTTGSPR